MVRLSKINLRIGFDEIYIIFDSDLTIEMTPTHAQNPS